MLNVKLMLLHTRMLTGQLLTVLLPPQAIYLSCMQGEQCIISKTGMVPGVEAAAGEALGLEVAAAAAAAAEEDEAALGLEDEVEDEATLGLGLGVGLAL